jgi:hypothetical protein
MSTHKELPVVVEQIVPSEVCACCDVCCRFPEPDSALRPYFTEDEIHAAIRAGLKPSAFPNKKGAKVNVVPYREGYICPAFEPTTGRCGIYESRPLDCRLYPIAVMWNRTHEEVVMGWDSKCPYLVGRLESVETQQYAARTAQLLETETVVNTFIANPQLIGAFQDDVTPLRALERITRGLRSQHDAR